MKTVRKNSGLLIAFMGLDGCGKTTQALSLSKELSKIQKDSLALHAYTPRKHIKNIDNYVKSHSDDPLKKILPNNRSVALMIDVWEKLNNEIIPALNVGTNVLLESYYYNSLAFAPLFGASPELISDFSSLFPEPDILFYLRLTPEQSWDRVNKRHETKGEEIKFKEQPR